MSLRGVFQGQECFESIRHILNDKVVKFKSFPEFDCILSPINISEYLDEIILDYLPYGIEEAKHISDFRYNRAGWYIEIINRMFNYLTQIYVKNPKESNKKKMEIIWTIKEEYKKLSNIPFEFSARIFTLDYCYKKYMRSFYFKLPQNNRLYQIVNGIVEKQENFKRWRKELKNSINTLDEKLNKIGDVRWQEWSDKFFEVRKENKKKNIFDCLEEGFLFFIPLIYSLNPPIGPEIGLNMDLNLIHKTQFNPLARLIRALHSLEKLSTKDILNLGFTGIKKEISKNFEKFSYIDSLKSEQDFTKRSLWGIKNGDYQGIPFSLLSLRADLAFTNTCFFGIPVSIFKYFKKGMPHASLILSLMIYDDYSYGYDIRPNYDDIGMYFLKDLYFTSLGDNILRRKKECPFKGSVYDVECDECRVKFGKKFCKKSGMINT